MKHDSFPSRWLVLVMILSALAGPARGQSIIFVDADATGGANTGADWANAYLELQSALSTAQAGNQIWIAAGTYKPSVQVGGTGERYKTFQMINNVAIYGGFAGTEDPATFNLNDRDFDTNETILSGDIGIIGDKADNCYHVFYHPSGRNLNSTAILDGVTITAGNASGYHPHSAGGGMYNYNSSPTLTNCTFSGNSASYGGGMYNYYSSSPTLTNCTFSRNSAYWYGGGMNNYQECSPTVTNCTFIGNSAYWHGGGIANDFSAPTLTNCILWGNTAPNGPQTHSICRTPPVFNHCDIAGSGGSASWDDSLGTDGGGNIDADPLFVRAPKLDGNWGVVVDYSDLRLTCASPCLDAGTNTTNPPLPPTDLDGNPRIVNGTVDMGAYEGPNQAFIVTGDPVAVPEGATAQFTVALVCDPGGEIEVAVAYEIGDTHITVQAGAFLTFNETDYSQPQPITLAAAEDADQAEGAARFEISATGVVTTKVTAHEVENDIGPIIFVDSSVRGPGNGSSWLDAFTDLQSALTAAAGASGAVDQIWVASGTYKPSVEVAGTGDRFKTFQLINNLAIYGGFAGTEDPATFDLNKRQFSVNETILSADIGAIGDNADNCYHVFYHPAGTNLDSTAVLDGFVVSDGNADGYYDHRLGGGMFNFANSSPTLSNCTFSGNLARYDYGAGSPEGGGAGMYNCLSHPTLTKCTFSGNLATGEGIAGGGGMYNFASNPTLTNCMFNGNSAYSFGGGMENDWYSSPTLTNCTFDGNSARSGGGVDNAYSDPTLINCMFIDNAATFYGGGMDNYESEPTLTHCTFSGNSADYGGGMSNDGSNPTLTHCTFSENSAQQGGGMYNYLDSSPTLTDCAFSGNSAQSGGGMYNYAFITPALTSCMFSGNSADKSGGGMYNISCSPKLTNCTFSGNLAGEGGGGVSNRGGSNLTLTNCTLVANSASDGNALACDSYQKPSNVEVANCILWNSGNEIWNNDGSTIAITYSNIQGGWPGTGNINADPLFVEPNGPDGVAGTEDDNLNLQFGSPCIDAGDNDTPGLAGVTTDLDGNPRFVDDPDVTDTGNGTPPIVDMGAYERDPLADDDQDGIINSEDNCVGTPNPQQEDADGDGYGDACDACEGFNDWLDADQDGVPTACDNCPIRPNPDQLDNDNDGVGDVCDACPGTLAGFPVDDTGCMLPIPGDFDGDLDVDQQDFGHFQACLSGAGIPQVDPACAGARLDEDDDADQDDFAIFKGCISGPNIVADPTCAE